MIESRTHIGGADVASHYDALDPFYRELWGEHLHHGLWERGTESADEAVVALVRRVAAEAHTGPGSRVCDVGAGYGAVARMLADAFDARVTALTLSSVQYEHSVHSTADQRVKYILGDWFDLTFVPGSFDAVIAIESTAHMADKAGFFTRAADVLATGGRLVVCAWLASETARPWEREHLLEPICWEGRLPSLGTEHEYRAWIDDAGLTLESFSDLSAGVRRTWRISTARLAKRLMTRRSSWTWLLDSRNRDRVFALTVPRIMMAYATGCMRYGLFVASRP